MDCPFCSKPLQPGYLQSCRRIFFSTENRNNGATCSPKKGDLRLGPFLTATVLSAQYCPSCQ